MVVASDGIVGDGVAESLVEASAVPPVAPFDVSHSPPVPDLQDWEWINSVYRSPLAVSPKALS